MPKFEDGRLPDRFWAKISPCPMTGCWLWTGSLTVAGGYGQFRSGGRPRRAHRLAYETLVGPIPDGLHLDHLCRTPCCVNPAHLEPVTGPENTRRGVAGMAQLARTHCPRGHEYSERNTYLEPRRGGKAPGRHCRECHNARGRAERASRWDVLGGGR